MHTHQTMDGLAVTALLCALAFCTIVQTSQTQKTGELSAYRVASFENPHSDPYTKLNHVFFHSPSGNVYIGAVNSIFRLNNSLQLKRNASTALDCKDAGDCLNYNKVLFVEPMRNTLITCGSENDGTCQQRDLEELTVTSRGTVRVSPGRDKSTVSLLAPGPENRDWLYVASTYTGSTNTAVSPVTRRDLNPNTNVLSNDRVLFANADSEVNFNAPYRQRSFDIDYVYVFASNGYTYFVTAQQRSVTDSPPVFVSKMARVCHSSANLDSYTEITIQCDAGSSVYNLAQAAYHGPAGPDLAESLGVDPSASMLYAVFARNVGNTDTPSESSALCAFSVTDIENAFEIAVGNCIRNGAAYQVGYLQGSSCRGIALLYITNFLCRAYVGANNQRVYRYANNDDAVVAAPLFEVANARMSSIITSIEMRHTVAVVGTSTGTLLKVHIESGIFARHYETITLGDSPVLADITLSDSMQQIHVLTEQQLLRLRVENCNQYTSCEDCIGENGGQDGDPYCGWCTLESKCTKYEECSMADVSTRWLPYDAAQCLGITDTDRGNLAVTDSPIEIILTVQQLPDLRNGESYSCQFNSLSLSPATTSGNTIRCMTPDASDIPPILPGEDRVTMSLSVLSSETMRTIITSGFSFYDCSRHTSCILCVASDWDCDWCVFDNVCTHQSSECAMGDNVVTGNNNPDATQMQGPDFCPQLQQQAGEELVPVGVAREILVYASNLPNRTRLTKNYQCSLMVEGKRQTISATELPNDVIQCNSRMYSYAANVQELEVELSVIWNGDRVLDDNHTFTATLYKCHVDRQDCSRCLSDETARPELECRWCGSQCAFKDSSSSSLLDSSDPCPAPVLTEVKPSTGPMEGNTVIEITGTDIGRRFQDVLDVRVGAQRCDLTGLGDQYVTGRSVRCRTPPMSPDVPQPITLTVAAVASVGGSILSSSGTLEFVYKNPRVTSFSPSVGPAAGGTLITVTGTDLNVGRDIQVIVASNVPCQILSISDTSTACHTGKSTVGNSGAVSLIFDGTSRFSANVFTYKPNPNITAVRPLKSFKSGGRILEVNGTGFNVVKTATIHVHSDDGGPTFEECKIQNSAFMLCSSPTGPTNTTSCSEVTLGFMLDGVDLLSWSKSDRTYAFEYCPDPVFQEFEGKEFIIGSNSRYKLDIQGSGIDEAISPPEINVTVGTESCNITDLWSTGLVCDLPEKEPPGLNENGEPDTGVPPTAVVRWYGGQSFTAGKVVYPSNTTTILLATLVSAVGAFTIIIVIVLAVKYYKQMRILNTQKESLLLRIRELHEEILASATRAQEQSSSAAGPNLANQQQSPEWQPKPIFLNDKINIVPGDLTINFDQLDLGRVLGQGAFGRVYEAMLRDTPGPAGSRCKVAVKTIQDNSDPIKTIKFLEEGLMMKNFDHPNVLGLLGLTFDSEGQPLIVLPFMANGDLKSYLVKQKKEVGPEQLVTFALHVALGMEYLDQQKFVHRDLAARNCMVDEQLVVKIADFGLSRDLEESDYYTSGDKQAKLPIKWMAPESMERKVYNTKTDVWSYGVLLWEIFSGGSRPYPGVPNRDMYAYLKQGQRMAAPKFCPSKIDKIMQHCWRDSPKVRCSFKEIVEQLNELLATVRVGVASPTMPGSPLQLGESSGLAQSGNADQPGYLSPSETRPLGNNRKIEEHHEGSKCTGQGSYLIPMVVMAGGEGKFDASYEETDQQGAPSFANWSSGTAVENVYNI